MDTLFTDSLVCSNCGSKTFQMIEDKEEYKYQCQCCTYSFTSSFFLPLRYFLNDCGLYNIGDKVKIINLGKRYSSYFTWFKENSIDIDLAAQYGYESEKIPSTEQTYTIFARGTHEFNNGIMYLIGKDEGPLYLFAEEALEKVST